MLTVSILGRANVGKSTLFNKIAGGKFAIVHNSPGTTRDRKETKCSIDDLEFLLNDTAGLEKISWQGLSRLLKISDPKKLSEEEQMYKSMIEQSLEAVKLSHLVFFVIDGRLDEISQDEQYFARIIKRISKNIVVLVNKTESDNKTKLPMTEILKLGLGKPIYISAEHGIGFADIYGKIISAAEATTINPIPTDITQTEVIPADKNDQSISIAFIGRPNAGKSTIINQILGKDRHITGPKAGITRDTISSEVNIEGYNLKIIDTAGIRHKVRQKGDDIEQMSINETLRIVRLAHVVCLLIDSCEPFVVQDVSLASRIISEGRNIIIIFNKIDLLTPEQQNDLVFRVKNGIEGLIPDVTSPHILMCSAKKGTGVKSIIKNIITVYEKWNNRIKTSTLNEWLRVIQDQHKPPISKGRSVKLKYMVQIKTRPPTFNLYISQDNGLSGSYLKFLSKSLARDFGFDGIPIRIKTTQSKNPFNDKLKRKID